MNFTRRVLSLTALACAALGWFAMRRAFRPHPV